MYNQAEQTHCNKNDVFAKKYVPLVPISEHIANKKTLRLFDSMFYCRS